MRFIYKISAIALVVLTAASCGNFFELDFLENPNAVTPDNAGADFVFNNVQLEARNCFGNMHFISDGPVRHTDLGSETYLGALPPTAGNGLWFNAYSDLFPDVEALVELNNQRGDGSLDVYVGAARILEAYVMIGLVDMFGDVPWTEALQGTDAISPNVDPGEEVYAAAEAILDEAIELLSGTSAAAPRNDIFYGGDVSKWITAAKTIKLKIGITTRKAGGSQTIQAILADGDYIDEASEDFQFTFSTNRDNPNSRHPFYNNSYEANDGTYMATYFMWLLRYEKDSLEDPRWRYYFYRQEEDSDGQSINVYSCVFSQLPDPSFTPEWWLDVDPRMPYCIASTDGMYGRDHGNGQGIPPDGQIRTVYGLFPGGGKWDNNSFDFMQNNGVDGGLGAGIYPMITSYMVDLWRAEAALTGASNEDARALLESGVRKSIAKVRSFESKIPSSDLSYVIATDIDGNEVLASTLLPTDEDVEAYVAKVLERFDNPPTYGNYVSDQLDVVMKEFMIASWGNSYEMYNAYRRTGRPLNMQPGLDLGITAFPRSIFYPADNVNRNQNVSQKPDLTQLVFWDDGSTDVY